MPDGTLIGEAAARVMDRVREEFGDDATVESALVLVEVGTPVDDPDAPSDAVRTHILWSTSDPRPVVTAGLLTLALHDL